MPSIIFYHFYNENQFSITNFIYETHTSIRNVFIIISVIYKIVQKSIGNTLLVLFYKILVVVVFNMITAEKIYFKIPTFLFSIICIPMIISFVMQGKILLANGSLKFILSTMLFKVLIYFTKYSRKERRIKLILVKFYYLFYMVIKNMLM